MLVHVQTHTHTHIDTNTHSFDSEFLMFKSPCLTSDLLFLYQKLKSEIDNVMADILSFESSEERYV